MKQPGSICIVKTPLAKYNVIEQMKDFLDEE